jgi:hypothetical protein
MHYDRSYVFIMIDRTNYITINHTNALGSIIQSYKDQSYYCTKFDMMFLRLTMINQLTMKD